MTYDQKVVLDTMVRKPVEIATKQYDDAGRRVMIEPQAYGKPLEIPQGATFIVQVSKPDGHYVRTSGTLEEANGKKYICFLLTLQMLARFGDEQIDVTIKDGDTTITTMTLLNRIQRAAVQDEDIESSDEMDEFRQAIKDAETIHGYVEEAEQAAQTAEEAAASVEGKADEAAASARSAEAFATAASASAASAQSSGESAASSKTAAETAAINAASSERNAFDSATAAAGSARASSESAQSASASKESAAASATSASRSAETALSAKASASQSAASASSSAQSASQSATAASRSATAAAQSAAEAAESAATLTVDPTLTIAGRAADAKAAGDAISDLNGAIDEVKDELNEIGVVEEHSPNLLNPSTIKSCTGISGETGAEFVANNYKTSDYIAVESGKNYSVFISYNRSIQNPYITRVCVYDSSRSFITNLGSISSGTTLHYVTIPENGAYVKLMIANNQFDVFGTIMFSKVENDQFPDAIVPYGTEYKLTGFVDNETFDSAVHDIENIQTIIDDNFVPEWGTEEGTVTEGKFIESNGVVTDLTGDYSIRTLPVTPYEQYKISAKAYYGKYYHAFYDSQGNFISGHRSTETGTTNITDELVTAPANASTLVACGSTSGTDAVIKIITRYVTSDKYPWLNKKWVVVGDSLTQINEATSIHYFDYISDDSGITPYNMGVGGTGYCRGYDSNRAFYQRISAVPTDADVVTVFGSGNDMNIAAMPIFEGKTWAEALGAFSDTGTDTICGCVNTFLDNYFAVMTTVPIGIIAPTPWTSYPTTLLTNNRFEDYTNALKQIAEYRGVPFLDLYHHSNLRPENEANRNACFYGGASLDGNGDGVHPNELGHKIIAPKVYEFVKTMLLD